MATLKEYGVTMICVLVNLPEPILRSLKQMPHTQSPQDVFLQALLELEMNSDLKASLRELHFTEAQVKQ